MRPQADETGWQRTKRKAEENPFIFPAIAMTGYAMVTMFKHLYRNDKTGFQKSQRFRVAAQIMTFTAFAGGMLWEERRKKEKTRNAAEAKQAMIVQDAPPQSPLSELK